MLVIFYSLLYFLLCVSPASAETLIARIQSVQISLVSVKTVLTKTMPDKKKTASYERNGTGIILDKEGLIVTNTHIIVNAPHIYITLHDGSRHEAQVIFVSPEHDFSFIKIAPQKPLTPIKWADSSNAYLGEKVVGIGGSDYNNQSIMSGRVTGLVQSKRTGQNELLQLDLDLYHGDSGGPIFDTDGKLLGIVTGKKKSQNHASFAIASDKIREKYVRYKTK